MSFQVGIVTRAAMMIGATVGMGACGGSNAVPTTPSSFVSTSTPPPLSSPTWSLAGSVVNAADGTPIPGVTLALPQMSTTANQTGEFTFTAPGTFSPQLLTIQSDVTLTRETVVSAPGTRNIDVVSTLPPYSDTMYRELAFRGLEPNRMRAMFHWTVQPRFYLRTVFDDTREPVPPAYINMVTAQIERVTPQWTGYKYEALVTKGIDPPSDTINLITILFVHPNAAQDHCGASNVSCAIVGNPSTIWFNVQPWARPTCFASTSHVAHEVGHSLGFFHISGVGVMRADDGDEGVPISCDATVDITPNERFHARVMYSRPSGTTYPDKSPSSFSLRSVNGGGGTLVVN
jgi:hypothetical protein